MLLKNLIVLSILVFSPAVVLAGTFCTPVEGSRTEVECADSDLLLEGIEAYDATDEQAWGPKIRSVDFAYAFNAMLAWKQVGPDDVLVVDTDHQLFRRHLAAVSYPNNMTIRNLASPLPNIRSSQILPPQFPNISRPTLPPVRLITNALTSSETHPEIQEGVNTDGQFLYGRPGGSVWVCTGWSNIDSCKACCMGTRGPLLAGVYKFAAWCHGPFSAACNIATWLCHAGCAVTEAAMMGAIYYLFDECRDNCEQPPYWNDTTVDWSGISQQPLTWGDAIECSGWKRGTDVAELNGAEHISIPGIKLIERVDPRHHGRFRGSCVVTDVSERTEDEVWKELWYGIPDGRIPTAYIRVMGVPVTCPAAQYPEINRLGHITHEASHNGIVCLEAMDYRIVDIDPYTPDVQTPYVGYVVVEENDEAFYFQINNGSRLYLDGLPAGYDAYWRKGHPWRDWLWSGDKNWKIWVYGDRSGNRMQVERYDMLTPLF